MTEAILYEFTYSAVDVANPNSLVLGPNGVLSGTTQNGGVYGGATAFELTPPASAGGSWTETVVFSLNFGADGFIYGEKLAAAPDGTVYGTAPGGTNDVGMVFAITP